MCECLTYDDGSMRLCVVCADMWRADAADPTSQWRKGCKAGLEAAARRTLDLANGVALSAREYHVRVGTYQRAAAEIYDLPVPDGPEEG